jgi:ankyrin repeat protein
MSNRRAFVQHALAVAGLPFLHSSASSAGGTTEPLTPPPAVDGPAAHLDLFLALVAKGDLARVSEMLTDSPHFLYARDDKGQSAYLIAAYERHPEVMALLEKRGLRLDLHEACAGAKIDEIKKLLHGAGSQVLAQNGNGDTPLHAAARAGASAALDNVIAYGPNFSIANLAGATVAHEAVLCPESDAAESMTFATIGNAADPNLKTNDGETVLHYAARSGNDRIVTLLMQKGADVAAKNTAGETASDVAGRFGQKAIQARLASSADVLRDFYGQRYKYTRKFASAARDDSNGIPKEFVNAFVMYSHFAFPQVQKWVTQCPDLLNTRAAWDELSVEAAAHMGRADIGNCMLDRGATYSLATAVVFGSIGDVKRMLAEEPRSIHERGAHSFPVLWYTAFGEPKIETAEYLISQGADVKEDLRGRTVLHVAATSGHEDICRFYLEKGLDPMAVGDSFLGKQTAVKAAQDAGHDDLAKMLANWKHSRTNQ